MSPRIIKLLSLGIALILAGHAGLASAMDLGTNFWNPGWHRPSDCFQERQQGHGR